MAIRIRLNSEPLALAARTDTPPQQRCVPILASSRASDVLRNELARYCDGRSRGRSFLVSGHRGSGKTTLVDDAVLQTQGLALGKQLRLKPLPVYVQGPLLFKNGKDKPNQDSDDAEATDDEEAAPVDPPSKRSIPLAVAVANAVAPAAGKANDHDARKDGGDGEGDSLETRVLLQVAQGLHRAVSAEFSSRFHLHAKRLLDGGHRAGPDLAEMAARFQIELTEAPPPSRLEEFWRHADLREQGLLFEPGHQRGPQQGWYELVALTGVSHVYQRISGTLQQLDTRSNSQERSVERQVVLSTPWAELAKPLGMLATGGAVGTASAGAGHPAWALALGVAGALGAALVFKLAGSSARRQARKVDYTFMPDLKIKTLHRVMPELFERLNAAGLAPVFIVDELDKVDNLYTKLRGLLDNLKKLFAERAFTCLLVDRGFFEELHWREEEERRSAAPDRATTDITPAEPAPTASAEAAA